MRRSKGKCNRKITQNHIFKFNMTQLCFMRLNNAQHFIQEFSLAILTFDTYAAIYKKNRIIRLKA